jgi:hypothetical protein
MRSWSGAHAVKPQYLYYLVGDERLCAFCLTERGIEMVDADRTEFSETEGLCVRGHFVERGVRMRVVATR